MRGHGVGTFQHLFRCSSSCVRVHGQPVAVTLASSKSSQSGPLIIPSLFGGQTGVGHRGSETPSDGLSLLSPFSWRGGTSSRRSGENGLLTQGTARAWGWGRGAGLAGAMWLSLPEGHTSRQGPTPPGSLGWTAAATATCPELAGGPASVSLELEPDRHPPGTGHGAVCSYT